MNHSNRLSAAARGAVLACTMLTAPVAWSASNASLVVDLFDAQVVDLTPGDRAEPRVSFYANGEDASVGTVLMRTRPDDAMLHVREGSWQDLALSSTAAHAAGHATFGGGNATSPVGITMRAWGAATPFVGPADAMVQFGAQFGLLPQTMPSVVLAPWTAVVLSFDVTSSLATTRAGELAAILFEVRIDGDAGVLLSAHERLSFDCADVCQRTDQQTISLTVTNASNDTLGGYFNLIGAASGQALTSPVPEPGTAALWLAGLGLGGLRAHRFRRVG